MEKAGFKAFILSFSISLSTILAVDRAFLRTPSKNMEDIEISNKNIVLFINKSSENNLHSAPTKKIALTILPEIAKSELPKIAKSDNENLIIPPAPTAEDNNKNTLPAEDLVIAADNFDESKDYVYNYIPLNIEVDTNKEIKSPAKPQSGEQVIANDLKSDIKSRHKDTSKQNVLQKPDANINKIVVVKKEPEPKTEIKISQAERSISESRPQKTLQQNKQQTSNVKLAQETLENEPMLLIPLERGDGTEFAGSDMKIAEDNGDLQIAAADKNVPIKSIGASDTPLATTPQAPQEDDAWKSMAEIKAQREAKQASVQNKDSAWAVAKGRDFPKNSLVLEADTNKSEDEIKEVMAKRNKVSASRSGEIQVAGEMIDNLLIPIPQDILDDKNLTPQLTSSEENRNLERELEEDRGIVREQQDETEPEVEILDAQGKNIHKKDAGILSSISSIFSGDKKKENNEESSMDDEDEGLINTLTKKIRGNKTEPKILPTEIRLSFQPNRAEISGTTLQWIQAFGKKAAEEASIALEIRLNAGNDHILQQKRLNLLSNILTGRGVSPEKIRIVYTLREPNSFIMRTIWINEQTENAITKNSVQNNNGYYLQW